jgi:hypothetical protein
MPHPFRRARVLNAIGQALGDAKPLRGGRQQQISRRPRSSGHPAAIKRQVHRLAHDRWQTRQNPRTFVHGGRELRCLRLIRSEKPNHTQDVLKDRILSSVLAGRGDRIIDDQCPPLDSALGPGLGHFTVGALPLWPPPAIR